MSLLDYVALGVVAAIVVTFVALLADWLFNRTCSWCRQGPATMRHYLENHTDGGWS